MIVALLIVGNHSANAQAVRVEKYGVVLTREDSTTEWYLENTTKDSLYKREPSLKNDGVHYVRGGDEKAPILTNYSKLKKQDPLIPGSNEGNDQKQQTGN